MLQFPHGAYNSLALRLVAMRKRCAGHTEAPFSCEQAYADHRRGCPRPCQCRPAATNTPSLVWNFMRKLGLPGS